MSGNSSTSGSSTTPSRNPISAGFIARYFGLEKCAPFANLEENTDGRRIASQTYSKPLTNPLHLAVGREFEQEQLMAIGSLAERVYGPTDQHGLPSDGPRSDGSWDSDYGTATAEFVDLVKQVNEDGPQARPTVAWQAKLRGQISVWPVVGKADLVAIVPAASTDPYDVTIYVLEAKSSVTKRTSHRIQATVYGMLIEQALAGTEIDVNLEGSIVTPENELTGATDLSNLDAFAFSTMTATIRAALASDGSLTEAIDGDYDAMPRRLAPRCAGCPHEQVCLTQELETPGLGLGLLQLDEGLQETLVDIGISSLEDFADLVDLSGIDRYGEVDEWGDIPFAAGAADTVDEIRERTNISNLRKLAVGAARYVDEVSPGNADYWPGAIQGSGYGLPADDPSHIGDTQYPPNSLIKVFITVVPDPVRDCVGALAAHVSSSEGTDSVVAYPRRLPREPPQLDNQEQTLLFRFFKQLGATIERLAPDIGGIRGPNGVYDSEEGFPHIYFYTEAQREALMNAVRRHDRLREADAVRSLLGLREAISDHDTTNIPDQKMVSVLSQELRGRFEMRFIGLGLVQTVAQFYDGEDWFGWDVAPYGQHGSEPSLTEIFAADLFELEVGYTHSGGAIDINHTGSPGVVSGDRQPQFGSSYPMANRHETTLPVAYIWAERDRLTPKWANDSQEEAAIQRYRYRTDSQTDRITQDDIETILKRISAALAHIERGLEVPANGSSYPDAGKDAKVPKVPLEIPQLTQLSQGRGSLASTVQEYALLEHDSGLKRARYKYRQPLDERIESGRSLVFEATRAWEDTSGRYPDYYLTGDIIDPNDIGVGGDIDRTIPRSVEEGDWMVITELDPTESPPRIRALGDRARIVRSTVVKIESMDDDTGRIRVNCMDTDAWLQSDTPCVTNHRNPEVIDGTASGSNPSPVPDYLETYLQAGRVYVLDEFADSIDKMRSFPALTAAADAQPGASGNSLYEHVSDLYNR
jgi:uncharacterized protein